MDLREYNGKYIEEEVDKKLSRVKFFVEGDSYDLWEKYSNASLMFLNNSDPNKIGLEWEQDSTGWNLTLDTITYKGKEYPLCVSLNFATINGVFVCFYEASSLIAHHGVVRDFLETNWPVKYDGGTRLAFVNQRNFHNCVHYLMEERNKRFKLATHD